LEMAQAAKKKGYKYIAITDHTPTVGVTHGLTPTLLKTSSKSS